MATTTTAPRAASARSSASTTRSVALVELGGRLVREEHVGADDEAAGAGDALHLAAGELFDLTLAEVGDAEAGQGGLGLLVGVGRV